METKWLYGTILVLAIALSGTIGYLAASENDAEAIPNSNSGNYFPNLSSAGNNNNDGKTNTISVTGIGSIEREPSVVEMRVGVVTEVSTDIGADGAIERNSESTNEVIQALKDQGIPEENIETTGFDLDVRRTYEKRNEITGYRVTHTLKVSTSDLEGAGELIDAAVNAGANNIGNVRFTFSKNESKELESLARTKAAQDAREKAEAIAESLGVEITGVASVSEGYQSYPAWEDSSLREAKSGSTSIVPPKNLEKVVKLNVVFTIE